MVSDAESLQDVLDGVDELVDETRAGERDAMPGKPLGGANMTDAEFMALWAELAVNPNWVLHLAFVEGGVEWMTRYEKLRLGSRLLGVTDGSV